MRIVVDRDLCSGHGRCFAAAPELYELDELGFNRMDPVEVPEADRERALAGASACPEGAITVIEQ